LEIPEAERVWAETQVPAGVIHMSLCSANPLKEWPVSHHAQLVHLLREAQPGVVVAVSVSARPREQQRLEAFQRCLGRDDVLCLPSTMGLGQLAAVLARSRLHIGPDSGVIHLAAALGLSTVSFFRRRGEGWRGWVPEGERHRAFLQECSCVRDDDAPCAAVGVPRCLEGLLAEEARDACLDLLGEVSGKR